MSMSRFSNANKNNVNKINDMCKNLTSEVARNKMEIDISLNKFAMRI